MTNTRCDVVFVTGTDYKVVFASVQSWQVVAVVVVGGGDVGGGGVMDAVARTFLQPENFSPSHPLPQ